MVSDEDFGLYSYRIFRNFAKKNAKKIFGKISDDLHKSGIRMTIEEYFSTMVLIEVIAVPLILIIAFFFAITLTTDILLSIGISLAAAAVVGVAIFAFFYLNPSNMVAERAKKIDNGIHFASLYMATLANTGTPAFTIFKIISEFDEFGEISKVAGRITNEIEVFGYNLPDSLAKHAELVPSNNLSELLWGIRATIVSGGDLNNYLNEKSKTFVGVFKRRLEEYISSMSLFMEMYITVVIVGTIFVIVLSTIMSMVGGVMADIQMIQFGFVSLLVPFITTVFILFLKTISPTEV